MTDLATCVVTVVICYTLRSVFFRWADHIEQCAKHKRTAEPDVLRRLERER